MSSCPSQMLAFKKRDLALQCENSYAYTAVPTHHLQSVTASAIRFFSCDTNQTQPQAQPVGVSYAGTSSNGNVLEGLHHELDSYLSEAPMPHIRYSPQECSQTNLAPFWDSQTAVPEVCDPLQYWKVCSSVAFCAFLTCLCRALKGGFHTSFSSQWTYSLHKHPQLLVSGFFLRVRKRAPVVETASIQNSWKHFKRSNFHFVLMLSILPSLSMCNHICTLL